MSESEEIDLLRRRVYYAARDGMAITLLHLLCHGKHNINDILKFCVEEDGQKCTPLLIAALNGCYSVVKLLINKFNVDLEQVGSVQIDSYVIDGATPLWCAASGGHSNVVRFLLSHGADVDHCTVNLSTPLRAACFEGHMDIIKCLLEHGANVHSRNKYLNTCLMLASYRGYLPVVEFLLKNGADPDMTAACGSTALHFAAEHGQVEVVRALVKVGAKMPQNNIGMTPLMFAAESTKSSVVEFLLQNTTCTNDEIVTSLELLGASFANDKDNYSLTKSFHYLTLAMTKRESNPELYTPKSFLPPIPAYDNHTECRAMSELLAIEHNQNAMHMESLVIRERILGSGNPEVPHPIVFRGALYADVQRFDRCVALWLHALRLRQAHCVLIKQDLLRFSQLFAQMIHIGVEIEFDALHDVLEINLRELQKSASEAESSPPEDEQLHTVLYLLVVVTKISKKLTMEQLDSLNKIVYSIAKLDLRTKDGSTLLHLAVNSDTPVDEFHTKYVYKFPCVATAQLLIGCGADVNVVDRAGNTPLHVIVAYRKPITDFLTLHGIITRLVEAGCHVDRVNAAGESPFDVVLTGVAEIILKTQYRLSLKCLAARAVRRHGIQYRQLHIPETVAQFADMHGALTVQNGPCKGDELLVE